jgi:hypothetical protein
MRRVPKVARAAVPMVMLAASACVPSFTERECYSDEDCPLGRACSDFVCIAGEPDGGADAGAIDMDAGSTDRGVRDGGPRDGGDPDLGLRDPCTTSDETWVDHTPRVAPLARDRAIFAYSAIARALVFQGGVLSGPLDFGDDTWIWNGSRWILEQPSTSDLGVRYDHAAAEDRYGNVVAFGGRRGNDGNRRDPIFLNDTWTWDGINWIERSSTDTPPVRVFARMAYDANRRVSVLFGGTGMDTLPLADTWEWDGDRWLNRTSSVAPPARTAYAMAYDGGRGAVIVYGGKGATTEYLGDVWSWDGTRWREITTISPPPPRNGHNMAYDERRRVLVVFGGVKQENGRIFINNETWELDLENRWRLVPAPAGLMPPTNHMMAYDRAAGRIVMTGGYHGDGVTPTHGEETWLYCGP